MNGQQLKNSILQMAVQGKLVPQDPNDEPASVLIQRIRAEKEKLIKEKKIKKEKNPSYIFRGSDNLHYEKVGDGEPVCIEEQLPFEIPDSWEWVRLGSVSTYAEKKSKINASEAPKDAWGLDLEDIEKGGRLLKKRTIGERKAVGDKTHFSKGNILYSKLRPYLLKILVAPDDGYCSPEIIPFSMFGGVIHEYVVQYLRSPYVDTTVNQITYGVKMPRVGTETMVSLFCPIPPLAEQRRIVSKIEQILPHIKEYELSESKIVQLNAVFPEQLKKSILQEAVQGKLVPQDPSDEPASVLLERIREEKNRLIKEGKIKKDKIESIIFKRDNSYYEKSNGVERCIDGEIPFEIPDSWKWVRLNKIVTLLGDGIHGTPLYDPKGNNYFINGTNIKNDRIIITDNTKLVSDEEALKHSRTLCDNTLLVSINGTLGNVAYYKGENIVLGKSVCYFNLLYVYKYYIGLFLKSFYVQEYLKKSATGSTIKNVPLSAMRSMLVPIPPIGEQKRIVAKIEQFLAMIKVL